ncbi:MAG: UDP-N-acetylmuramoyl-tripeptide--D-alanyl-D-alanine ligase [Brumimicrobium sp.]|nr:UDP-N-acetylmuramoyl-tripeptide--D-alanyl-D-alanine ligase [Brumimicrobium sp.]MCO5268305.1 UDP-N-acetylmuramoyl-tripeptide--D-alanyl-D-alanine ligase [Brumimicrobium sp.]
MQELFQLFYKCSGISTDTRKITKDSLFIALKGENFDGNEFALKAIEEGAKYAIVQNKDIALQHVNIQYTPNTLVFLQKLAEYHRNQFQIPVIGITGTNGKTTTKEFIAAVLSKKYNVLYTQGNLNNHIGVPLTLLNLTNKHEIAIIEMGASKLGDIKELTDIAHPNYGIITNIGQAHIEGFGSVENIIQTKTELYRAIEEVKGTIIYNKKDQILLKHLPANCTYATYGSDNADITGEVINLTPQVNFQWKRESYSSPILHTQIIGKYNFNNLLAAITFGHLFHVESVLINAAIEDYIPSNNRSQLKETEKNTLIMDAYNANPTSVHSALENFANIETDKNKMFILGDMLELGSNTNQYHKDIISESKKLKLQGIFVGSIYHKIAQEDKDILAFPSTQEAQQFLSLASPKGNLILLKGSRGIGLEKLVEIL